MQRKLLMTTNYSILENLFKSKHQDQDQDPPPETRDLRTLDPMTWDLGTLEFQDLGPKEPGQRTSEPRMRSWVLRSRDSRPQDPRYQDEGPRNQSP